MAFLKMFDVFEITWLFGYLMNELIKLLTTITSLWPISGCSSFRGALLDYWYQKKALIGFLGALASFFLRVFFTDLESDLALVSLPIFEK